LVGVGADVRHHAILQGSGGSG